MTENITKKDCETIVARAIGSELSIVETKLLPAKKDQDGFFGDTFLLEVAFVRNGTEERASFFVKTLPRSGERAEMARALLAYDKEIFFYRTLLPEFRRLRLDVSFAPEYYFSKNESLVVFEELTARGFGNRTLFGLEEAKSALRALALFHAASLLYEDERTGTHGRPYRLDREHPEVFEERFFRFRDETSFAARHFSAAYDCLVDLVELLPEEEATKSSFLERVLEKRAEFERTFRTDLGSRKVCSHGDLWRRNVMFQAGTNDCRLVDFQMLRYHYPAFDVLTLLTFCTSRGLREARGEELLVFYHNELCEATGAVGEPLVTFRHLVDSTKHLRFLASYQAFAGHLLDVDSLACPDALFGERRKYARDQFQTDEAYRETVTDDIYSLLEAAADD